MLDVRITSSFENQNLINGFLPFQWQGVEFIAKQPRCAYMRWDTGTGKTLMAEAAILIKRAEGYNLTVYIVRLNHMIGAQRKLKEHTGLDAYVMLGTKDARRRLFEQAQQDIIEGKHPIIICNAEKLSKDKELFIDLITDRKVLFIIDEASKYGNRKTKLYRNTCEVLYKSYATSAKGPIYYPKIGKERAAEMFILALSATPITHNPENLFNVVRLMDPSIFGTVSDFYNRYVAYFDRWGGVARWRNLEDMAVRVKPILHQVNKRDPEIAVQFPESMPHELIYCILDDNTQRIYNELHKDYRYLGVHDISYEEIFPAIQAMQMLVNNPRIVLHSAMLRQQFEDDLKEFNEWLSAQHLSTSESIALKEAFEAKYRRGNAVCLKLVQKMGEQSFTDKDKYGQCVVTKMLELRSQLQEHDEKAIVFSVEQTTQQHIAEWLDHWGITYVIYHGALNINQRQAAIDNFRRDSSIQVFLSTDAGQDSIDLPESSLTIHYDWPWSWAAIKQRENRQHRIDSDKKVVRVISLTSTNTIEDRKAEVIDRKRGFHETIFEDNTGDFVLSGGISKNEWLYILTGNKFEDDI